MDAGNSVEPISQERLVHDLEALGVRPGDLLNIKVSMRSIGYVVGGPRTLIEAMREVIGPQGTIVAEAFVKVHPLPLSKRDARRITDRYTPSYAGALANTMLHYPEALCSRHPVQRFVGIGGEAKALMEAHGPESYAYDVLGVMARTGRGRNLKIGTDEQVVGVGTTHVAIGELKLHQNRPRMGVNYYDYELGQIRTFERNWSGGCVEGFNSLVPLYRQGGAVLSEGRVGNAESKISDMKKTLEIELEALSRDPTAFFCTDPACEGCRLTWDFSTGSARSVRYHRIKKGLGKLRRIGVRKLISRAMGI